MAMSAKPMTEEMRPRLRQKGRSLNNNPWEPENALKLTSKVSSAPNDSGILITPMSNPSNSM